MKHKHYEMIVAKAANMDLVVFIHHKSTTGDWCIRTEQDSTSFYDDEDYFLCLPQHEEACLHWLNGGGVQIIVDGKPVSTSEWQRVWSEFSYWNSDEHEIRIKPKKEKRWIAVLPNGRVSGWHDDGKKMLKEQYNENAGWQFIEIEVEV